MSQTYLFETWQAERLAVVALFIFPIIDYTPFSYSLLLAQMTP